MFDSLLKISERHSPNEESEIFVSALLEGAAEFKQAKSRVKCRIPVSQKQLGKNEII